MFCLFVLHFNEYISHISDERLDEFLESEIVDRITDEQLKNLMATREGIFLAMR